MGSLVFVILELENDIILFASNDLVVFVQLVLDPYVHSYDPFFR